MLLILFTVNFFVSFSQWKPVVVNLTPRGGTLFSRNSSLYCNNNGVFVSDDMGVSWRENLRAAIYPIYNIWSFTFVNNNLMVLSSGDNGNGLYVSNDNGYTWTHSVSGINNPYFSIIGYCQTPSSLFIYGNNEIYKTTNHVTSWEVHN